MPALAPIDEGFNDDDGVNTVLFDDPHFEIEEEFDCSQGGVLAIGGPFYTTTRCSATRTRTGTRSSKASSS